MGIVVAAHHLLLDERVAIKFLRSDSRDDDALRWARRLWGRYGGLPDGEQIIYDMVTRAWERRTAKDHEFTLNDAYRKIEQARHYWDVEYQINLRMASSLFGDVDA